MIEALSGSNPKGTCGRHGSSYERSPRRIWPSFGIELAGEPEIFETHNIIKR
jgi:hypothetical protein